MPSTGAFLASLFAIVLVALFCLSWRNERAYWRRNPSVRASRRARVRPARPARHPRQPARTPAPPAPPARPADPPPVPAAELPRVPAPPRRPYPSAPPPAPSGTFAAGAEGEARVAAAIAAAGHEALHGVFLPSRNGYSQFDHIVRAGQRIVVVETKNLAGTLEGRGLAPDWTQHRPGGSPRDFFSPVLQVGRQVETLRALDPAPSAPVEGWVVLAGRARPPSGADPRVLHVTGLRERLAAVSALPGDAEAAAASWDLVLRHVAETPQAQARAAHDIDHERRAGWRRPPGSRAGRPVLLSAGRGQPSLAAVPAQQDPAGGDLGHRDPAGQA